MQLEASRELLNLSGFAVLRAMAAVSDPLSSLETYALFFSFFFFDLSPLVFLIQLGALSDLRHLPNHSVDCVFVLLQFVQYFDWVCEVYAAWH